MPEPKPVLTIVSPVYKAERIVSKLVQEIQKSLESLTPNYEIILVEDGSPDGSWSHMEALARNEPRLKAVKLSRNFGQHHAITAGLDLARGEWVVVMDCDLQDNPAEIPHLYSKAIQEGWDIVQARRLHRQDSWVKRTLSSVFYFFFSYLTGVKQDGSIANYGIYHSKAIAILKQMREPMRAFPAMINWVGFKRTTIEVKHQARFEGISSYNWRRLVNLALDFTLAYSDKPLRLTVKTGMLISLGSALYAIYILIAYWQGIITEPGYTSLIISIWFLSGLMMFTLGVLGLYLGKVFESVKARPIYIIDQIVN